MRRCKHWLLVVCTTLVMSLKCYENKTTRNIALGTSAALGAAALTSGTLLTQRLLQQRRHTQHRLRYALRNPAVRNLLITGGISSVGALALLITALQYAPPSPENIIARFGHNQNELDKAVRYWYPEMTAPSVDELRNMTELPKKMEALAATKGDTDASIKRAEKMQKSSHSLSKFVSYKWSNTPDKTIKVTLEGVNLHLRHHHIFNTKDNYCFYHALMYGLTGYNYLGGMLIPHLALYLPTKEITKKTLHFQQSQIRKRFYEMTGRTIVTYNMDKFMGVPILNYASLEAESFDPKKPIQERLMEALFIHSRSIFFGFISHAEFLELLNRDKTRTELNHQTLERMLKKLESTLFINNPRQQQLHNEFCLFIDIYILSKASELGIEWTQDKSMSQFMHEIEQKDFSFKEKVRDIVTRYLNLIVKRLKGKKFSASDVNKFVKNQNGTFLHSYLALIPKDQRKYADRINRLLGQA